VAQLRPRSPRPDAGGVPVELRRFDPADPQWSDPSDDALNDWATWGVRRYGRWGMARRAWAIGHGFDVDAPYGAKPGHDWWAFLDRCRA
jgi:hypothetical protein